MSSKKVIDIANSLEFISDYNSNGITGSNSRISTSDNGELLLYYGNPSINSTTGTVVLYNGGLSINTTELATSYTSGGGITIRGGGAIGGDLYVGSNIYVESIVSSNSMVSLGITTGNINFTGDIYKNGSIYVSSQWTSDTNGSIIYTGGNVGISTTSPIYLLDINGTSRSVDILATNSTITTLNLSGLTVGNINFTGNLYENGNPYISSQWFSGTGGSLSYTNGNVGIGTTSPNSKFDIRGDINVSGDSNSSMISASKTGNVLTIKNTSSNGNSAIDFNNNSGVSKLYIGYANSGSSLTNLIGSGYLLTEDATSLKIVSGNNITIPVIINSNDNSVSITTTTDSDDIYSGSLKVAGGASIEKSLYIGDDVHVSRDLYVDGAINGAASSSSTFAYLTLTSTDSAINMSTGSLVTYGGITIQNTENAYSTTQGGSLLAAGGASIMKSVYVGEDLYVTNMLKSTTISVSNLQVDNITMGTIITELNLGLSNIYSGSFTPSNNITSFTDIVPLIFDNDIIRSFVITLTASITADTNLYETFILEGVQTDTEWDMYTSSYGDTTNIAFDITSSGHIQYTTPNFTGFVDAIFNYHVEQIRKTGSSQYTGLATNGTLILNTIQLLGTEDSNRGVNNGALYISGGCTVEKTLYSLNLSSGNAKFTSVSSGNINISGDLIVGGTLTTVNITTTNISETNVSAGNVTATNMNITNSTVSNIISTNINATAGSIGSLITTNADITTGTIATLISSSATITNASVTTGTVGTLISSNATITNANVTTGTVGTLISSSATITNANVTTGTVGTLIGSSATITNASLTTGTVGTLIGSNVNVTTATVGTLSVIGGGGLAVTNNISSAGLIVGGNGLILNGEQNVTNITPSTSTTTGAIRVSGGVGIVGSVNIGGTINAPDANVTTGTIGTLISSSATVTNANLTTGTIGTLVNSNATVTNANVTTSTVGTLLSINANVTTGTVGTLLSTNANVTTGTIGTLINSNATITNANVTTGTVGTLLSTNANVTTGTIGTLLATNANLTTGTIGTLINSNATITNANVTTGTVGTLLSTNANVTTGTVGTLLTTNLLAVGNSNTVGNIFTTGGNVGIGTITPGGVVDVKGTSSWGTFRMAPSTSGGEVGVGFFGLNDFTASAQSTSGNWLLGTGISSLGASNFGLLRNTTAMFAVSTSGNMTVVGDITAFGSISDMRFKTDIDSLDVDIGFDIVNKLRPVTFIWNENITNVSKRNTRDIGFIAQEVESITEYAVDDFEEIGSGNTYKKIKHERLIPYLVLSIQKLNKENEKKNNEIENLKTIIKDLLQKLD